MKLPVIGLGLLALATLAGCGARETYLYRSTPTMPQSVSLVDISKGETVWAYEIPVGQELKIQFRERAENAEARGWDTMEWYAGPIGSSPHGSNNNLRVPPPSSRMIKLDVRKVPETRADVTPASVASASAASAPSKGAPAPKEEAPKPAPTAPGKPAMAPKPPPPAVILPDPKQPTPR